MTVLKEVDVAFIAAQEANWLALLRLNDHQSVIEDMENSMDIGVSTIAQWAEVRPPDEKRRKARDRFLTSVKVYHESYPASGADAARINALLVTVQVGIHRALARTAFAGWMTCTAMSRTPTLQQNET